VDDKEMELSDLAKYVSLLSIFVVTGSILDSDKGFSLVSSFPPQKFEVTTPN
jgi:hypothetical protein